MYWSVIDRHQAKIQANAALLSVETGSLSNKFKWNQIDMKMTLMFIKHKYKFYS